MQILHLDVSKGLAKYILSEKTFTKSESSEL